MTIQQPNPDDASSTKVAIAAGVIIFLALLLALFRVYATFPKVTEDEKQDIKLPRNMKEAKRLGMVLNRYKGENYFQVMAGVFATYIFLQISGIPVSFFLSVLSGFLFPFGVSLILACTGSVLGASLCFLFSYVWGRRLVLTYYPKQARTWTDRLNKHRGNLFNYMLFLRITPFVPNWFINVTSPVVGVPWLPFAVGTFVGVAPPSVIAIQGGQTLQNLTAEEAVVSARTSVTLLAVCSAVSLLPIALRKWLKKRIK